MPLTMLLLGIVIGAGVTFLVMRKNPEERTYVQHLEGLVNTRTEQLQQAVTALGTAEPPPASLLNPRP